MNFETIRVRALPALAALALAFALALAAAAPGPAGADATASKTSQAKKKAKKAKQKAKKRKAAKKRRAQARKRAAAKRKRLRIAGLKFYQPPKRLPKRHGTLIWQRKAGGVVPLKSAKSTQLVLYTSTSPTGRNVAVSGSVSIPKGKAPKGGWPLITYGHGTTGIADKCAPSRNTKSGPAVGYINYTDDEQNAWLEAGYAVARSDYQGLGTPGVHPFLVGQASGRSVLDIARAARQMGPKISKSFLIAGHSQGGHAALFAAGEAAAWVPDLSLKGTVSYAPASQFKLQASALATLTEPSGLSALATMLIRGVSSVYDTVDPREILSDGALAFWGDVDEECLPTLSGPDKLGGLAPSTLLRNGADLSGDASKNLLGILDQQNPAVRSEAPILLTQGTADDTTPPYLTDVLSGQLTAKGSTVDYKTYPGADHSGVLVSAHDDVMAFFASRLPGGR